MKKLVAFVGSPRKKGNTDTIVGEVLKGIDRDKISVKLYYLNDLNIKGCQGCLSCRKNTRCVLKDDMVEIYEEIKVADYIVIGSPVYICQVSSQTKVLLDRLYPLTEIDKWKHTPRFGRKKVIMVYTQAAPFRYIFKRYFNYVSKSLKGMGLEVYRTLIVTKTFERDSTKNNKKVLKKAYKIGRELG